MKPLNLCSLDELQTLLKDTSSLPWERPYDREDVIEEMNRRVDEAPEIPEHWHSQRAYFS